MLGLMYEKRPLKRPRLGPPDVYPQEPRQKEDELTLINVKHGFPTTPQLSDEFGTARNCNITAAKVGAYFSGILTRKEELSTLPDCGRKRQQVNSKDNFWPATARSKGAIDAWFKDLAGSKPLMSLAKKAPNFNKKEEIFTTLTEHQVSMARAAWFIKLSSAYTVALSEAKGKKRQLPDPTTEWTSTLIRFLKDLIPKLAEHYQNPPSSGVPDKTPPSNSGNTTPGPNQAAMTPGSAGSATGTPTSGATTPNQVGNQTPTNTVPHSLHSPGNPGALGSVTPTGAGSGSSDSAVDSQAALRQWTYCTQLARWLIEEGLIDRHELLTWIIELLDMPTPDDGLLRLFLPLTLQYMSEFSQCELLARRLSHTCARKLATLCQQLSESSIQQLTAPGLVQRCRPTKTEKVDPLEPSMQEQVANAISMSPLDAAEAMDVKPSGLPGTIKKERADAESNNTSNSKPVKPPAPPCPVRLAFQELLACPHHRDVLLQLSTIIQIICLECSTALVWSGVPDGRSALHGSPLDMLPVPPSALPMPFMDSPLTDKYRRQVYEAEQEISIRSKRAENKWCADKWQTSSQGTNTTRVLAVLEALDRHSFDRVDNSFDVLYNKVFGNNSAPGSSPSQNSKDGNPETRDPEWACSYPVVLVLCEWAVCSARWGEHRAVAAAALLDRRQQQLLTSAPSQPTSQPAQDHHGGCDDKESISSGAGIFGGPPVFQSLLMRFLDNDSPVLEEGATATSQNKAQFTNLVHLFGELIRRDVFSHDAYMCTLISRGDLLPTTEPMSCAPTVGGVATPLGNSMEGVVGHTPHHHHTPTLDEEIFAGIDLKPKIEDHVRMDYDDAKIDDDLDKLLQHIKQDQQNSMDAPDSPKEPGDTSHGVDTPMIGVLGGGPGAAGSPPCGGPASRHLLYTTHFPLPWHEGDGGAPPHDTNQRHVLLYGVGRHRNEARNQVKKMSKEICKLFSKKFSIDVAEGGKVKKHSRSEFNFEAVTQKFQNMNYFDQHVVSWQCGSTVVEMLQAFALSTSSYLPVQEHVAFLFDLMELAVNVYGLIDICIQILKELLEVESVLASRSPGQGLLRSYTTSLALYVVGVLRRYHCCLLLWGEQTSAVFEQLCRLVKPVVNPGDCSSAERCILAHLHDLYTICAHLRSKTHQAEPFSNAYPKIRQVLYAGLQPTPSNYVYNPQFLSEVFANPRRGGKIEVSWARQLSESPNNRYSFVCSAILSICREVDNDRVNDIAISCAETTACCGGLSAEWLGALMALCNSSSCHQAAFYPDLLQQVDVQDLSVHNSLAVFTCILIARHCFSLEGFVCNVALPSLLKGCNNEGRAEAGARLTCHLLLRLFKTVETPQPGLYSVSTSPHPAPGSLHSIRLSCDRHLLAAAHKNIAVGPLLATLKAIQVVGDATARDGAKSSSSVGKKPSSGGCELSHILGTSDANTSDTNLDLMSMVDMETTSGHRTPRQNQSSSMDNSLSLSEFARHVLAEICGEEWVMQKCLQSPEELCQPDMLLDSMLTNKQAQRLLHMICYPETASHTQPDLDQKTIIVRILENLEQWSLRMSWLDLQLMFKQFPPNSPDLNQWLETVARAAIEVFHIAPQTSGQPVTPSGMNSPDNKDMQALEKKRSSSIWLVAPLVSRLPPAVQGRVLRVAGQLLEGARPDKNQSPPGYKGSQSCGGGGGGGGARKLVGHSAPGLRHQPFLSLVLTCLRGQDDQKEGLLTSLHTQLSQFLQTAKDERQGGVEDYLSREMMVDALQLRFSLLGGMFDTIQRNATVTTDWAILLVQLISYGVIDHNNNASLFTTVLDMLGTLVHWTLANDSSGLVGDENKRQYQNLMKKLKKEVGERHGPELQCVRQLLPLPKITMEVIACEPVGCLTDTKGNKITGFDSIDKKQGLRLSDKQRVSAWEIVEGGRVPAPLSWAWFGATKMDRKPLTYEHTHRLLRYHTHCLVKPANYYLEPLPLPPEDLEPPPEKPGLDSGSLDQSPTGVGRGRARGRRPRKNKANAQVGSVMGAGGQMYPNGFAGLGPGAGPPGGALGGSPGLLGPPGQMMGQPMGQAPLPALAVPFNPDQQQMFHQQQRSYYHQMGRFERPVNQSKQALSNMLRQRQPMGGAYPGVAGPQQLPPAQHRPAFVRQQPRAPPPHHMQVPQGNQMGGMGQMGGQMSGQMAGQMGQMGGMGQMGAQGQMAPGQMTPGQMGPGQMGPGQMVPGQMGQGQMGQGQMGQAGQAGQGMFAQQYAGMQQSGMGQGYAGAGYTGQQMMQAAQQGGPMAQQMAQMGQGMGQSMGQGVNQMGQGVNQMGQGVNQMGQAMGQMGQGVNQMGQPVNQMGQAMGQMGQGVSQMGQSQMGQGPMGQAQMGPGQMGQGVNQMAQSQMGQGQMGQSVNQMGQGVGQMGQGVGQMVQGGVGSMGGQAGPMGQGQGGMGGFPNQQSFQQSMMGGRGAQDAYMAQQRQAARPQYMQGGNVGMGGMGGPAPPYSRPTMPNQQNQQFQQQQRMRHHMLAIQQQHQQQQQQQQQGTQPSGLMMSRQYQPPPY